MCEIVQWCGESRGDARVGTPCEVALDKGSACDINIITLHTIM